MSFPFVLFIAACYLAFSISCMVEGKYLWALVGLCWGVGNLGIGAIMVSR